MVANSAPAMIPAVRFFASRRGIRNGKPPEHAHDRPEEIHQQDGIDVRQLSNRHQQEVHPRG
jgi:hypothetical protein